MTARSPEQRLIDIMFSIALQSAESMHGQPREHIAGRVRQNLKACGFPVHPVGSSWGVLDQQPCEMDT
jgi:hypothetical protein